MESSLSGASTLVTGGAGFIGSHLVDELLRLGATVRVLDDLSTGRLGNLAESASRIEIVQGDIRDVAVCRRACEGVDVVFHQAAVGSVPRSMRDPATTVAVNAMGTTNVLVAARDEKVSRVVFASSSSVYGDGERLPKAEGEEGRPLSPYAQTKVDGEAWARLFGRCFGLETVGLRYFNVFGPRQDPDGPYAAVIPRFFAACLARLRPEIDGDGEQSRDFTFVSDAVQANVRAALAPAAASGRAYNIAGGARTTVNQLAALVGDLTGASEGPVYKAPRPGDIRHSFANLSAARQELGYEPRVLLADGLRLSLDHYVLLQEARQPG